MFHLCRKNFVSKCTYAVPFDMPRMPETSMWDKQIPQKMCRRLLEKQLKSGQDCVRCKRKQNHTDNFGLLKGKTETSTKTVLQKNMKNSNRKLYFLPLSYGKEKFSQSLFKIQQCKWSKVLFIQALSCLNFKPIWSHLLIKLSPCTGIAKITVFSCCNWWQQGSICVY